MILKMLSFGLFFDKTSYFRNIWNFLDFFIVLSLFCDHLLSYLLLVNISFFRNLIVLRLLKLPFFKLMIQRLLYTLNALIETYAIFIFFITIFAILSLQLFNGILKFRCVDVEIGLERLDSSFCSFENSCKLITHQCIKALDNPKTDLINFDNFFMSFVQTIRIVSLDNWANVLILLQNSFSQYIWVYIFLIIVVCNFFVLNIMLAVLKVKFSEQKPQALLDFYLEKYKEKSFDLREIKKMRREKQIENRLGLVLSNNSYVFPINKMKNKRFDSFLKKAIHKKMVNPKQSVQLKKILEEKKKKIIDSLSDTFKGKFFEIRVKRNDLYECESLYDVVPSM